MSGNLKLEQTVTAGAIRATNFFNGRLVSAEDLTREQTARREADKRLGATLGSGVACGLKVAKARNSTKSEPIVTIEKGLAINRAGQTLRLEETISLGLAQRQNSFSPGASDLKQTFADCQPLRAGGSATNFGLYLLVIGSAESREGLARSNNLRDQTANCATDQIVEAARFRLIFVDPFLANEPLPAQPLVQNYAAHLCFGTFEKAEFYVDPLGFSPEPTDLLDRLRRSVLTDCDVPLALLSWTNDGLQFIDNWAARRRLTRASGESDWTALINDRRASEAEAMQAQFCEQIALLQLEIRNLESKTAADFFRFLPPAAIVPLASSVAPGFDLENFFGARGSSDVALLDGERLPVLLHDALRHAPVDLQNRDAQIQLYLIRENLAAFEAGAAAQLALVFAKHTLPYFGTARFGAAEFGTSRFAQTVI